jgi:hypothetical protein
MKAILPAVLLTWLLLSSALRGESYPAKTLHLPRYSVGCHVQWRDGSQGRVVSAPEWREGEPGDWIYLVQFGDEHSLCWQLPERGLEPLEGDLSRG